MKKLKKFLTLLFLMSVVIAQIQTTCEEITLTLSTDSKKYLYYCYLSPYKTVFRSDNSILLFDKDVVYRYEKCNYDNYLLTGFFQYSNWGNHDMYLQQGGRKTVLLNIKDNYCKLFLNNSYQETDEYLTFDTVFCLEGRNVLGYRHYFVDNYFYKEENNIIKTVGCGLDYVFTNEYEQIYNLPSLEQNP